jgi:DNA-binding transcriptional LysR family regulator
MQLTEAGRELASRARKTLESAGELLSAAGVYRSQAVGVARMGLNNEPGRLRMTEFLARMRERHPRVELHIMQYSSPDGLDGLATGEIDAAFVYEIIRDPNGDVASMPLGHVDMAIVGPADWRSGSRRRTGRRFRGCRGCGSRNAVRSSSFWRRPSRIRVCAQQGIVGDGDATLRALWRRGSG